MKICLDQIRKAFDDLIKDKKTREEIASWAWKLQTADDNGELEYYPPKEKSRIWEGITYLIGVDSPTTDKAYLYSVEDFEDVRKKIGYGAWPIANVLKEICRMLCLEGVAALNGCARQTIFLLFERIDAYENTEYEKNEGRALFVLSDEEIEIIKNCIKIAIKKIEGKEFKLCIGVSVNEIENIAEGFFVGIVEKRLDGSAPLIKDTADAIEDGWLMCPICVDAWQTDSQDPMVRCPKCEQILHNPRFKTK